MRKTEVWMHLLGVQRTIVEGVTAGHDEAGELAALVVVSGAGLTSNAAASASAPRVPTRLTPSGRASRPPTPVW